MREASQIISDLVPTLEPLEESRQLYQKRQKKYLLIIFSILAAILVGGYLVQIGVMSFFAAVSWCAIGFALYQYKVASLKSLYVKNYKKTVIPALVKLVDSGLKYEPGAGISMETFKGTELFSTSPNRYSTEDLIHGTYGKTYLQLAEVEAKERRTRTDSNGNRKTYYVTIFKGLLLIADFHKDFHGRTFVFPDISEKTFGNFARFFQKMGGRRKTNLIRLEDPEFEKAFAVYSTDEVEARYVLSTAMLRRILDMRQRFGEDVRLGFKDSCLTLAVPHKSTYLEPSTSVPATDTRQIEGMLLEFMYFLDTIEELDLNTRIWSKE